MHRMRTTIDIPDAMYRRLKARAATEGKPAKALILKGVEQVLRSDASPGTRVVVPVVPSKRPGSLRLDNARIYDLISSSLTSTSGWRSPTDAMFTTPSTVRFAARPERSS